MSSNLIARSRGRPSLVGPCAEVAQLVEQWTENPCVPSSSLGLGTTIASCPIPWHMVGDRLMAGLRTLDPSIGVRIPVPQP